jgi:hypothetical protein
VTADEAGGAAGSEEETGPGGGRVDDGRDTGSGDAASRGEFLGGTGNAPEASRELADPSEHPEQHAALHTGGQAKSEPDEGTDNELLDSEEHSEGGGAFGTADEDD